MYGYMNMCTALIIAYIIDTFNKDTHEGLHIILRSRSRARTRARANIVTILILIIVTKYL